MCRRMIEAMKAAGTVGIIAFQICRPSTSRATTVLPEQPGFVDDEVAGFACGDPATLPRPACGSIAPITPLARRTTRPAGSDTKRVHVDRPTPHGHKPVPRQRVHASRGLGHHPSLVDYPNLPFFEAVSGSEGMSPPIPCGTERS